jgi:hypothetical protein
MKISIHLLRSIYSLSLIKVQTDIKLWNIGNMDKRTPFWLIQKPERLPRSSLAILQIS